MDQKDVFNDSVATEVVKQHTFSKEWIKPYFDRFLDNYKHYFLRVIDEAVEANADAYPFYSQLMIPVSYQIVETLLPRMFARMMSFTIKTEEENDEKDEIALQELIRYQMNHPYLIDDPIFSRFASGMKEEFIAGNAWLTVPWHLKEVKVKEWQPYSKVLGIDSPSWDNYDKILSYRQQPDWAEVEVTKRVIDAPVLEHKSLFNIFPDPKAKRVSDMNYGIEEDYKTLDQLMEMVNISPRDYQNIDELKKMEAWKDNGSAGSKSYLDEIAGMFGSTDQNTKDETAKSEAQYKVLIRRRRDTYDIVVNDKLTIRTGSNPDADGKVGLVLLKDIPVPNQLFAWGEVDPIKKIEDQMSDLSNMRFDSVFRDLLRMWKLNPNALVDGEEFIPEPGSVIQMSDLNGLQPVDVGVTQPSAYREYQEWESIIQATTGVTDYATGASGPGMNKTAQGVDLLQQAANARFAFKLQLFEQIGAKAVGTMYVNRNLRYYSKTQSVDTGKGKMQIKPEQIRRLRGNIHFTVDSGSTQAVNQEVEMRKWDKILELVSTGRPPFNNLSQEAQDYVAMQALRAIGERNPEKIVNRVAAPVAPKTAGVQVAGGGAGAPADLMAAMAKLPQGQQPAGMQQPQPVEAAGQQAAQIGA